MGIDKCRCKSEHGSCHFCKREASRALQELKKGPRQCLGGAGCCVGAGWAGKGNAAPPVQKPEDTSEEQKGVGLAAAVGRTRVGETTGKVQGERGRGVPVPEAEG